MSDPAVQFEHRTDIKAVLDQYTIAMAELGYDQSRNKFRWGDGSTLGGFRFARENWRDTNSFTLAANTNDWAPAAFEELGVLLVTASSSIELTGLAGGLVGRDIEIRVDRAATGSLKLKHQSGSSLAANRFNCPTGKDIVLSAGQSALLSHDGGRWAVRANRAVATGVFAAGVQQELDVQAALDALAGRLAIAITRTSAAAPGSPSNGASYLVPTGATGAWAGQGGKIATWASAGAGAWVFTAPIADQYVISLEDQGLMRWNGTDWAAPSSLFFLGRDITPAAIAADANDWAPANLASASVVRFSTDQNGRKITGLAAGRPGEIKVLLNVGAASAVFTGEDAGSAAANRFSLGARITVRPTESITLRYDATASRWTLLGRSFVAIKELSGEVFYTGAISPVLDANVDDWAPAGFAGCNTIYVTASAPVSLTGLAGGADGREITIFNMGTNAITLKDQAVTSNAANRLAIGADLKLDQYQSVTLIYNSNVNRWLMCATTIGVVSIASAVAAITAGTSPGVNDNLKLVWDALQKILAGADATIDTLKEVADIAVAIKAGTTTGTNDTLKLVWDEVARQRAAADANAIAMAIALG